MSYENLAFDACACIRIFFDYWVIAGRSTARTLKFRFRNRFGIAPCFFLMYGSFSACAISRATRLLYHPLV
jgi:hypothetical protein